MIISILSFYSGTHDRGVETWAENLKHHLKSHEVKIVSGNAFKKISSWVKSDIIIPTGGRAQVFYCRILTWFSRKLMIVFGHSGPGADDKWNLLCMPNVFVAFSNTQKKWAEKHKFGNTKVERIYHAVDLTKFTPQLKRPRKKIVLCVAPDIPNKRVGLVRDATAKIRFNYVGIGKGNDKTVPFNQIPKAYKEADIFCFVPEPWEAFGLVFLEALASNLPVVTSSDPIRREVVGSAGLLVDDPQNLDELSKAIEKAYETDWGSRPKKQAEKFSWDKIVVEYESLFKSL